jgi:hypothetical protein
MNIRVLRTAEQGEKQTIGVLYVEHENKIVFECKTLELAWKNNERRVSCIPAQKYIGKLRKAENSPSRNYDHIHITNVPNRSWILIHSGNYHFHILGCILVGEKHVDMNRDGLCDVSSSRKTMSKLMEVVKQYVGFGDEFEIIVEYRP